MGVSPPMNGLYLPADRNRRTSLIPGAAAFKGVPRCSASSSARSKKAAQSSETPEVASVPSEEQLSAAVASEKSLVASALSLEEPPPAKAKGEGERSFSILGVAARRYFSQ